MITDNSTLALIVLPIVIVVIALAVIVTVIIGVVIVLKKHGSGTYRPQRAEIDRGLKLQEKNCYNELKEPA